MPLWGNVDYNQLINSAVTHRGNELMIRAGIRWLNETTTPISNLSGLSSFPAGQLLKGIPFFCENTWTGFGGRFIPVTTESSCRPLVLLHFLEDR